LTGIILFNLDSTDRYDKDGDHFAQIMELFGEIPRDMLKVGKDANKYFDEQGL
jgi:serine/threonine-protein kinase SRPK3